VEGGPYGNPAPIIIKNVRGMKKQDSSCAFGDCLGLLARKGGRSIAGWSSVVPEKGVNDMVVGWVFFFKRRKEGLVKGPCKDEAVLSSVIRLDRLKYVGEKKKGGVPEIQNLVKPKRLFMKNRGTGEKNRSQSRPLT